MFSPPHRSARWSSTHASRVARPLGLALATTGRLDEADEAFAQAAAVHERIDAPIELDRALTTADNLGLATIQRQAQALLATLAAK